MNGVSRHMWNMASFVWVIYSPEGQLVYSGGVCMEPSTNNVVEYSVIIELLRDTISHGVRSLGSLGILVTRMSIEWKLLCERSYFTPMIPMGTTFGTIF
jgi:hypothetical protein